MAATGCQSPPLERAFFVPGQSGSATIVGGSILAAGSYTGQIVLTSQTGTMAMTVPVILTVGTPTAAITSVTPNTGQQGQTLASVTIVGQTSDSCTALRGVPSLGLPPPG